MGVFGKPQNYAASLYRQHEHGRNSVKVSKNVRCIKGKGNISLFMKRLPRKETFHSTLNCGTLSLSFLSLSRSFSFSLALSLSCSFLFLRSSSLCFLLSISLLFLSSRAFYRCNQHNTNIKE